MSTQEVETEHTGRNELAERTGPFYNTEGLVSWLGIDESEVKRRISSGEVLTTVTADEVNLFPVWQFNEDGTINPDLLDVIAILNSGRTELGDQHGWTVALWLSTKFSGLQDADSVQEGNLKITAVPLYEHLKNGIAVNGIKELATNDANRWNAL